LPEFRSLIDAGKMRLKMINHKAYQLPCRDFGNNPTPALLNVHFWQDEFLPQDSDYVLILQDDSVVCRPVTPSEFAYVGGVWPRVATELVPFPPQGMCFAMEGMWKSWTRPQRQWAEGKDEELKQTVDLQFPLVCSDGRGPVGNGGFSWRSRKWMIRAIETCPHARYSGTSLDGVPCKVLDQVNEDVYFSVVLRGLGAPLPSAAEAARFAVETLFLEDVIAMYGGAEEDDPKFSYNGRQLTVPIGVHKPYWYLEPNLLHAMKEACPFLKYIYRPADTRWKDSEQKEQWTGIGT
jgi:hypothetical protein